MEDFASILTTLGPLEHLGVMELAQLLAQFIANTLPQVTQMSRKAQSRICKTQFFVNQFRLPFKQIKSVSNNTSLVSLLVLVDNIWITGVWLLVMVMTHLLPRTIGMLRTVGEPLGEKLAISELRRVMLIDVESLISQVIQISNLDAHLILFQSPQFSLMSLPSPVLKFLINIVSEESHELFICFSIEFLLSSFLSAVY
jgi:hypothetical protein